MTKTLMTLIAAAALMAAAAPAMAADETQGFTVSTSGLDLQSASGAKIMLSRIQAAAGQYCGSSPVAADLGATAAWRSCVKTNVAHAVTQLKAPMVTVAYTGPDTRTVAQNSGR